MLPNLSLSHTHTKASEIYSTKVEKAYVMWVGSLMITHFQHQGIVKK